MRLLRFGSVFAGIGGFDVGLESAGHECVWQIESDRYARQVLRRHWPDVQRFGDVSKLTGDELSPVDLMVGGFPCQDVSTAGKREGVEGERSGLFREFFRLVRVVGPEYILLENVPGLLSRPEWMGAVLGELAECGYDAEWRVLNSRFFGVPQNRPRVFIVGHPRGRGGSPILAEPDGVSGDFAKGGPEGEGPSSAATRGATKAGREVSHTVTAREGKGPDPDMTHGFVAALTASGRGTARAGESRGQDPLVLDDGRGHPVAAAQCHGSNVGPPGVMRAGNSGVTGGVPFVAYRPADYRDGTYAEDDHVGALTEGTDGSRGPGLALAFAERSRPAGRTFEYQEDRAYALTAAVGGQSHDIRLLDAVVVRRYTPRECERLQGFPDDHTAWGLDRESKRVEVSDTQRYKQIGNAVTVPVAEWIGRCLRHNVPLN